jgi:hypothetical protein
MRDPETREQSHERHTENRDQRVPFDSSDLNNIPRTTDEDPPYRNWWVVNDPEQR